MDQMTSACGEDNKLLAMVCQDMVGAGDDSDDEDDVESSDEDEATPKKVETGKKRAAEAETKTPGKKAKLATPTNQKTGADGKKGGQAATPHPSKQAGKRPLQAVTRRSHRPQNLVVQSLASPVAKLSIQIMLCKPIQRLSTALASESMLNFPFEVL